VVNVLSKPLTFGLDSLGKLPPPISATHHTRIDLKDSNPTALFHPDGYKLSSYPILSSTVIPQFATAALLADPPPILCHVRGFGTNFDAQNIAYPLLLDNICQATQLDPSDVFLIPTVLQAKSSKLVNNLRVLIEEDVLTVLYNPLTVSTTRFLEALQSLGLADSTQSSLVSIRTIPFEYISHSDTLLLHPVPLHALEQINCILIPLSPCACGIHLVNLLISSGSIQASSLKHFTILPSNPHERHEYSYPRLYIFLSRGSQFRDSIAFGHPSIFPYLAHSLLGKKRSFKLNHLPGLHSKIQPKGQWSLNRFLITGTPKSTVTHSTNPSVQSATPVPPQGTSPSNLSTNSDLTTVVHSSLPKMSVQYVFQQIVAQHSSNAAIQERILAKSEDTASAIHDLINFLKASAPGSGAAHN
jgi:hypothetical protein